MVRYTLQANNESSKYFQIQTIPKQMPHNVFKKEKKYQLDLTRIYLPKNFLKFFLVRLKFHLFLLIEI